MTPLVPSLIVGSGALLGLVWLAFAIRRLGLRRPILLVGHLLGALPLAYLGLAWVGLITERYVRIERPFVTLIAAAALAIITLRLLRLTSRGARRWLTELLLTTSALAAALAAMGLSLGRPLDRLAVLVAIDRSRSIDLVPNASSRIRTEIQVAEQSMREDDRVGVLAFAAQAAMVEPLRAKSRLPAPQEVTFGRDATDLGAAIRRALAEVPADAAARIVLLSDGVATRGDALDAASAAVAADVPIDVVPLDQRVVPDVRVVSVRTPSRASEGEAIGLRVVTHATQDSEIDLEILRDGEPTQRGRVRVRAGEDVIHLREEAPGPGLRRFDVKITAVNPADDEAPEDNTGSAFVRVRGPASALIIEGDAGQAAPLEAALKNAAFRVSVAGTSSTPSDIAALAAYDVVVLSDVPASALSQSQLDALGSYVRDLGGGLLLMGGDRSLGPGGFGKTPVEEVSPVSFDLKQERKRATLAEVIIIDYSGSMAASAGKHSKLELANEAAARSAELLGAGDRLGVMHVDTTVSWTVPLGPLSDKAALTKKIRDVKPGGGGIYIDLSLKEAFGALRSEKVALKHVLLFSDGGDAEEKSDAFKLIQAAKLSGITTSVVALGRGSDVPALERMSQLGDGRFYLIEDAGRLPAVFAQETILAARSAINEVRFTPAVRQLAAPIRGVDLKTMPDLAGYVVTIPKGRAQVLLEGPEGDPVLATWSVGIGRSAVFTSDYKDRWGSAWTHWEGAQLLFAQLARDIARTGDDPRVRLEADAGGGELHVRATLVDDDGRAESFRRLKVRVAGPEGYQREVALEATGAGAYAARVAIDVPGPYIATGIDEFSKEAVGTTGAVLSFGDELRPTGTDRALLARIAALTGGKERDTLAGLFHDRVSRRFAYRTIDDLLLWVAALSLLLGVGARRLAVPTWLANLPERVRRLRAASPQPPSGSAEHATLGALLERKAKAEHLPKPAAPEERPPARAVTHQPLPQARPITPSAPRPAPRAEAQPTQARHLQASPAPASSVSGSPTSASPAGASSSSTRPSRQLSAAEILLQRRRGRR